MAKGEVHSEKIHLHRIIPQKEYFDHDCDLKDEELELHIAQNVQHSLETNAFKISLLVFFTCNETKFAEYLYDFIFGVENMRDFLVELEDKEVFQTQIVGTLVDIAYSTLRGLVYSKIGGTNLSGFVLPVINPNEILKFKI